MTKKTLKKAIKRLLNLKAKLINNLLTNCDWYRVQRSAHNGSQEPCSRLCE